MSAAEILIRQEWPTAERMDRLTANERRLIWTITAHRLEGALDYARLSIADPAEADILRKAIAVAYDRMVAE